MHYFVFYVVRRLYFCRILHAESQFFVVVPFCEFLVGEQTPDLTTKKGKVSDSHIFLPDPNWDVQFYVPSDGIEDPSCLVSQIVHSFVKVLVELMFRPRYV
jgi:hypothetical protein